MTPKQNSANIRTGIEDSAMPATAKTAAAISASFSDRAMAALSKRSANSPPNADSKRKGAMKMAPAKVTSDAASSAANLNRMRNTNVFFRKLSLNADRNCVQKSGANRRDVIRCSFMMIPLRAADRQAFPH